MPDFLSRLVGRTFGLVPVAQPVTRSIFAPESHVRNDYMQALSLDRESVSSDDKAGIDSFQDSRIIRQHSELSLNQKKLLNKDGSKDDSRPENQIQNLDSQSDLTSTLKPSYNVSPNNIKPRENNSNFPERVESTSLHHMSEQDNQHQHTNPAELFQDNKSIDKIDHITFKSNTFGPNTFGPNNFEPNNFESIEPDFSYDKSSDDRRILQTNKKSILNAEQFHRKEQDFQGYIEPFENNVADSPDEKSIEYESDSSPRPKVLSNLKSSKPILQNSEQVSRADFYISGGLHSDTRSLSIISSKQNLKQVGGQKTSVPLEKIGNMLPEQYAVAVRPPSTSPTIKVTIGRIEVRAVKPPIEPQLQAPPKQQPILSLDDYLKQYNG